MSSFIQKRLGNISRRPRPRPTVLRVKFFSFLSRRFQPNAASQTNVRAQEPDLRLRHRLHHQRHAYRSQSSAAERHEVGETPLDQDPEAMARRENNTKIFEKTIALLSNTHTRLRDNRDHRGHNTCREGSILMAL